MVDYNLKDIKVSDMRQIMTGQRSDRLSEVISPESDYNADEPSKADVKDPEMGIWLSNGFTREFQEIMDAQPDIVLRDLYYALSAHTVGSHATVYNVENYGNMYKESMSEYFQTNQ